MTSIGILAYGSLIKDPGSKLSVEISSIKNDIKTPFNVEFARYSSKRGGAPTLIPVEFGGTPVNAKILVLKEHITEEQAMDMLYRRETHQVDSTQAYRPCRTPGTNTVCINKLRDFHQVGVVLYTSIAPNINDTELTPTNLAFKAIESVGRAAKGKDGISYLIGVKSNGIRTPLSEEYEEEIKKQSQTRSLEEALEKLQSK